MLESSNMADASELVRLSLVQVAAFLPSRGKEVVLDILSLVLCAGLRCQWR